MNHRHRIAWKARATICVVAALGALGTAWSGSASSETTGVHYFGTSARAIYELDDAYNTTMTITAIGGKASYPRGVPEPNTPTLLVDVWQEWCNTVTDEFVTRSWSGGSDVDMTVDARYLRASWPSTVVELTGLETRYPRCVNTDWDAAAWYELGTKNVALAGTFTGSRPWVRDNAVFREAWGASRFVTVSVARAHLATVELSGTGDLGGIAISALPEPAFAYIGHTTRIERIIPLPNMPSDGS